MIYPQIEGSNERPACLTGKYFEDEFDTGEFRDSIGNIFVSKEPKPEEINEIEEFIREHFHHKKLVADEDGNPKKLVIDKGKFIKGRLHGWGEVHYKGGDIYRGMFKDGKRSGFGSMVINQTNEITLEFQ
jgi:hypothetical protein